MTPEGTVVAAVEQYFSQPKFQGLATKREYPIKIGSDKSTARRADVVLFDRRLPIDEGNLPLNAIVECKRIGVKGEGREQLKSYLSASDTRLGIFANSSDPNNWEFYKNQRGNRFDALTRSQFERRIITARVSNFLRRAFRFLPKGTSGPEPVVPPELNPSDTSDPDEPNREPIKPPEPSIHYKGRYQPLQNEYRENTVEPNLNGKPYYSEENGFYWAANHQGIAECVPQHIKRIIHNEELEIASTRDELEQQINDLREAVVDLEVQKSECEQEIGVRSQELAEKKEELAGLEVQLKVLAVNGLEPLSTEGIPDDSNSELFTTSTTEDIPDDPIIQRHEEINELIEKKANLEQIIDTKNQALARKKEEFAKLEVELQGPTETELNPIAAEPSSHNVFSVKQGFSWMGLVTAIISTVFFACLATYLFIFYASAVDKAFFLNTEAIQAQLAQGTYAGVNDVVNPKALFKAFQGEWNLFVLMFPFVFLAFAIALDYFWEQGKLMYLVALLLGGLTLIFDSILAIQISQKIHQAKILMGQETEQWAFRMNDLNMWTVIFCGFVVSLLVSIMYHVMNQRWQAVSPPQENSKTSDLHELQIKSEKTQREASIAVLKTEMDNLQSDISRVKEKDNATQQKIIRAVKTPLETQIVVLKTEMDNLQTEINQLKNNKEAVIQQKIEKADAEITKLSSQRNKRVVNRNKMESQVNQFLNGWCRFVAHSGNGISDELSQIDRIKQVAKDTLDDYYQGIPDYTAQS